ncbi:MAG: hypothetical protein R3B90_10080 [Planctomycetaceae bacterium]
MTRIFATLAIFANVALMASFALGWSIGDAKSLPPDEGEIIGWHVLIALGSSLIALLVHAVALTYFMGTGRWIEETTAAYSLPEDSRRRNIQLKYSVLPGMIACILLLIATGSFGAVADPASAIEFTNDAFVHFACASTLLVVNSAVNWLEWDAIARNGRIVDDIVRAVNERRTAAGLPTGETVGQ